MTTTFQLAEDFLYANDADGAYKEYKELSDKTLSIYQMNRIIDRLLSIFSEKPGFVMLVGVFVNKILNSATIADKGRVFDTAYRINFHISLFGLKEGLAPLVYQLYLRAYQLHVQSTDEGSEDIFELAEYNLDAIGWEVDKEAFIKAI